VLTKFNPLQSPKRGIQIKGCPEIKGAGECKEHYYSQMQNWSMMVVPSVIKYKCLGLPDVKFKCKKGGPHNPAMKLKREI